MKSAPRLATGAEPAPPRLEPLRRVLVATDFSKSARRGTQRAVRLPLALGARIHVVHVLPPQDRRTRRVDALLEEYAGREFRALVREMERALHRQGRTDVSVESEVAYGSGFVEIVQSALAVRAELIVVGRIGRQNWRHLLIGSTAERVVWSSPIPVLVTHDKEPRPYRRILAALDGTHASRAAFRLAIRLGDAQRMRVEAVHAVDLSLLLAVRRAGAPERRIRELADGARRKTQLWLDGVVDSVGADAVDVRLTVGHGHPVDVIQKAMAQRKPDLVVLGTRRQGAVRRALLGSVAEAIVRRANCDVLIARERATGGSR